MLCPNTQAATNIYAAKTIFSQSVSKFGLGDRKKCKRKEVAQPHLLPRSPEIWIYGWGKWKKSV